MRDALAGVETLILVSAPVTPGIDRVQQHRTAIDAARAAGVQRIVFTSVIGNGREAGTGFEATQAVNRRTEQDLKSAGLAWTIARNALYLDLDLEHIQRAAQDDGVYRNNGDGGRCAYMSIAELAYGLARLALDDAHAGRCYNLSGETLSQAELVGLTNEVFGLAVRYEPISREDNLRRLLAVPRVAARGEEVARMLTGCFECIANGAFDVPSDYATAAGRPPRLLREQMQALRAQQGR